VLRAASKRACITQDHQIRRPWTPRPDTPRRQARCRSHYPDGPKANQAPMVNTDHSNGAAPS